MDVVPVAPAAPTRQQQLADLAQRLGTPGGGKLYQAARRQGLRVSKAEIKEFLGRRGEKQIFRPLPPSRGQTAAEGPRTRFQMDLVDLKFSPSKGFKNILLLVNVYTRQAYAANIKDKRPATVAVALEGILNGLPAEPIFIFSDRGNEFTNNVQALLEQRGITQKARIDKHDPNPLSVIDRVIQNLKKRLAESLAARPGEWSDRIAEVVAQYNATPHSTLHGEPPDDVRDSDIAEFMLQQDNARKLQHNQRVMENRKEQLKEVGGFRRPIGGLTKMKRGFRASYGPVEQVESFDGSKVKGSEGFIDVKRVLPVDKDSGNVQEGFALGEGRLQQKRELVYPLALSLYDWLGDERKSMEAAAMHLRREFPDGEYQRLLASIRASRPSEFVDLFDDFQRSRDGKWVERA